MQNETKIKPPRKKGSGGDRKGAGRTPNYPGETKEIRITIPIEAEVNVRRIVKEYLNNKIMKTLLLLLIMTLIGCDVVKEDEVKPQLPPVKTLSKSYFVEFKFTSTKLTGDVWTNGVFDYNVATTLVDDNYAANDTTSGNKYKINFEYSFESNKVNNLFFNIKNVIPRGTQYWYVATITVDENIVASDSIYGGQYIGKEIHLNYVIEK